MITPKKIWKKLTSSEIFMSSICFIVATIIKLVHMTCKWEKIGYDKIRPFWNEGKPVLIATWHARVMMLYLGWDDKATLNAIVSPHRDGRIIAGILKVLGVSIIPGSSNRDARKAAVAISRKLQSGESVAITPDGPRGPRMRMGNSLVYFAKKTGFPIFPMIMSANKCLITNSWDRFMIIYPFAKGVYMFGEPLYVPSDADDNKLEELRLELENRLNDLSRAADTHVGIKPVEPAEL